MQDSYYCVTKIVIRPSSKKENTTTMDCHDEPKFSYSKILLLKNYKILHVFEMVHILGPAIITQPNIFFFMYYLLLLFFVVFFSHSRSSAYKKQANRVGLSLQYLKRWNTVTRSEAQAGHGF